VNPSSVLGVNLSLVLGSPLFVGLGALHPGEFQAFLFARVLLLALHVPRKQQSLFFFFFFVGRSDRLGEAFCGGESTFTPAMCCVIT